MTGARRSRWTGLIAFSALLFLYVPLILVVLFSFHKTASLSFPFEGFSTRWYTSVFSSPEFRSAATNSLIIAVCVSGTTLLLGTAAAYGLSLMSARPRRILTFLFFVPLALPGLYVGLALLVEFNRLSVTPSLLTVALAHWVYVIPYFMIIAIQAFASMDPDMEDLARDLGASSWRVFWRVTIPELWPLLLGAAGLAFALSFDEFIITFFVIGTDSTLPLFIWSSLRRIVDPSINVVSTVLLTASLLAWVLSFAVMWKRELGRRSAMGGGVR